MTVPRTIKDILE